MRMKKLYVSGGIYLMVLSPGWAATQVPRTQSTTAGTELVVVPVFMEETGPRSPGRLRDLLRQTAEGSSAAVQPYRLTPEERQRLREQLRQQAWPTQPPK